MTTTFTSRTIAGVAIAALGSFGAIAYAQDTPTPRSAAPAGQGPGVNASSPATSGMSDKSRASVKSQTRAAEANGTTQPAGQATQPAGMSPSSEGKAMPASGAAKSRAGVKAETKAAQSSGSLQPAGEAPRPANEAPKK